MRITDEGPEYRAYGFFSLGAKVVLSTQIPQITIFKLSNKICIIRNTRAETEQRRKLHLINIINLIISFPYINSIETLLERWLGKTIYGWVCEEVSAKLCFWNVFKTLVRGPNRCICLSNIKFLQ